MSSSGVIWFESYTGPRPQPMIRLHERGIRLNMATTKKLVDMGLGPALHLDIGYDPAMEALLLQIQEHGGEYSVSLNAERATQIGGQALAEQVTSCGIPLGRYPAMIERERKRIVAIIEEGSHDIYRSRHPSQC